MAVKERWKGALVMSILCVGLLIGTIYSEPPREGPVLFNVSASLLLMIIGLIVYLGGFMSFVRSDKMTEEEQSRTDDKVSAFIGLFLMLMSLYACLMMFFPAFVLAPLMATGTIVLYIMIERLSVDDALGSL